MEIEDNKLPVVQPNLVSMPHPLVASIGRKNFYDGFVEGESVSDYLNKLDIVVDDNFSVCLNGFIVPVDELKLAFPKKNDLITIRAIVHGGDDSNKVLRSVLTIAVIVLSQGAAAGVLGTSLGFSAAAGGAAVAVGGAIIVVGGMLLINALVPVKIPSFDDAQPSPTYSLTGSANRARLHEPMPLVFGVIRMYPDHGSKPYTNYEGTDQILTQIFNFGLSDIEYGLFHIGDTELSTFDIDINNDLQVSVGFTGELDTARFNGNVDTQIGGDLVAIAGSYIEKTTSINTVEIQLDFTGVVYYFSNSTGMYDARVKIVAEYSISGLNTWLPFFVSTTGGADYNTYFFIGSNTNVKRLSFSHKVEPDTYDVRVKVLTEGAVVNYKESCTYDSEGNFLGCVDATWYDERGITGIDAILNLDQIKSYQADADNYENQKRVGLSIRSTGQLNGRIDVFNCIVSAKVLVWTDPTWTNQISSNPAWQYLSLAKGKFHADGRRIYGAGLPESRIDIETIKLWAIWCDAKSLECNIVFDGKMTVIDMLNTIARCGRAVTTWSSGNLGVIYDEANKPAVSVFGMSNIIRNSFSVNYITKNQVDEVIVAFVNPLIGYKRDTISSIVPNVVSPVNSVTIDLKGITSVDQAGREANLIAAEQFYRRRTIVFESDMEGLTVQRGDVAILSHDMTRWDFSGRLISGTTTTLVLDTEVDFTPATQHYIGVRYPDGTYEIVDVDLGVGSQSTINLTIPLSSSPDADINNLQMDYMWVFGPQATPGKQIKITDVKPLSEDRVRITATDEDDNYYLSEQNAPIYLAPSDQLQDTPIISDLQLGETLIQVGAGYSSRVNVSWGIEGQYGGAFIQAKDSESVEYETVGQTLDRKFSFEWNTNRTINVRVVTYNLSFESSPNSSAETSLLLLGKLALPTNITNFSVVNTETGFLMSWAPSIDIDIFEYEIRVGIWNNNLVLAKTHSSTYLYTNPPVGTNTFTVKAIDTSGGYSSTEATLVFDVLEPSDVTNFSYSIVDGFLNLDWDVSIGGSYPIKFYRIKVGTDWNSSILVTETLATDYIFEESVIGNKTYFIKAIDIHGNESAIETQLDITLVQLSTPTVEITYEGQSVIISYSISIGSFPIDYYEIRRGLAWDDGNPTPENVVAEIKSLSFTYDVDYLNETFWVAAYDVRGNISGIGSSSSSITPPSILNDILTIDVIDNNVLLRWGEDLGTLPIKAYEIRRGDIFDTADILQQINGTFASFFENISDTYKYWIVGIDTAGNYGTEVSKTAIVNQPPDYVLNVNWLDDFSGVKTNCIIADRTHYQNGMEEGEIGDFVDFSPAGEATISPSEERFSGIQSALITYSDTVDPLSSGNTETIAYNIPTHIAVNRHGGHTVKVTIRAKKALTSPAAQFAVSYSTNQVGNSAWQPFDLTTSWQLFEFTYLVPDTNTSSDYLGIWGDTSNSGLGVLIDNITISIEGTNTEFESSATHLVLTANATETFEDHFLNNLWTKPSDQIAAGYDFYIQPSQNTGSYVQEFDYGTELAATLINIILDIATLDGAIDIVPNIKVKRLIGDPWIDLGDLYSVFSTAFRYVQTTLSFSSTGGDDLAVINSMNVKLDSKLKNDGGSGTIDVGAENAGFFVEFNVDFVDVTAINVSPNTTSNVTAIYDFVDEPNPQNFTVYLLDPKTGSKIDGDFSWSARGY